MWGTIAVGAIFYLTAGMTVALFADAMVRRGGGQGMSNAGTFIVAVFIWPWFAWQGMRGIVRGLRDAWRADQ